MLITLFSVVTFPFLLWLGWGAIHQFLLAVAGIFYKNPLPETGFENQKLPKIRVFIPACREDFVIENTARETLLSHYLADRFEVVVIADGLKTSTVLRLKKFAVRVLEVSFEKSTKSKALNWAIQTLENEEVETIQKPEIAVVLDADNVPARDFLRRVATHFLTGAKAVQGRRAAKNMDTPLALLDAASEDANNHILCRGARFLGWSARLAGSGMAFDYLLFASTMRKIDVVGGFDKALEGHLTRLGTRIEYDENAVVFDEKVSRPEAFSRQRSRWIAAQFQHFSLFFPAAVGLFFRRGNIDFFQKTLQMALPPRLLSPGLLAIGAVFHGVFRTEQAFFWQIGLALNLSTFGFALPTYLFKKENRGVWLHLPKIFWVSVLALTRLGEARRVFVVTPKVC